MLIGYMIFSVFTALICTALWLVAGGGWLAALLVYILSGNLAVVTLAGFHLLKTRR